jgi:hypothetical protein
MLARVSEWAAARVGDWNYFMGQAVTIWAAAAGPWIQDPFGFSIVRNPIDGQNSVSALDTMEVKC